MAKSNTINIITMGCTKNLVDSERINTQLKFNNIEVVNEAPFDAADTVVINTCGFIGDAKEESIEMIMDAITAKEQGLLKKVYVVGCLSQLYREELKNEIPEVDQFFGTNDLEEIVRSLGAEYKQLLRGEHSTLTPKHYAYLKISEGCNRQCAFCSIPLIRGKQISRPIDELLAEANYLVQNGAKELILIAQDLTNYGYDLNKELQLAELLDKLSAIAGLEWIRLQYAYPTTVQPEVIDLMRSRSNICNYLDIPIQHVSDKMLKLMRRGHSKQHVTDLLYNFRQQIPDVAIRTTLIVGHPGETEQDFEELLRFVEDFQFDRLGVFPYSPEEGTYANEAYPDDVPEEEKQRRMDIILAKAEEISFARNVAKIGKQLKVLIDTEDEEYYYGRSEYDSPEVDNEVLIEKGETELVIGTFYTVEITDAVEFDLFGAVV